MMATSGLLAPSSTRSRFKTVLWIFLGITALFVFITSEVFLAADYPMYHAYRLQVIADRALLIPHTLAGTLALLIGPINFSCGQAAAWVVCTAAAFITARNRQIVQHREWMIRSYAVTFTFVSSRVLNLWPRYWSHLGDSLSAVGVIGFTLASLLLVELGLNWHELTTRRA